MNSFLILKSLFIYCRRSVCYCIEGTPQELRDPAAAKEFTENARRLNEFWQRPTEALFDGTDAVDVLVPRLLRRERVPVDPPEASKAAVLVKQLEQAKKSAAHSAMMAASLAARGGLLYSPPLGIELPKEFLKRITMQDQTRLEEAVDSLYKNRAAMAAATAAVETTAVQRTSSVQFNNFVGSAGGGVQTGALHTSMPMPAVEGGAATFMVPQRQAQQPQQQQQPPQQQRMIPPNNQGPPSLHIRYPEAFKRGLRRRGPPKAWRLTPEHNTPNLIGKLIQLLVDSTREWRPALVSGINPVDGSALVVYESDLQQLIPLQQLIENGEVAWLSKESVEDQNSAKSGGGVAGGGGGSINMNNNTSAGAGMSTGRKRGGTSGKTSVPSKYQMVSPLSSSGADDSLGIPVGKVGSGVTLSPRLGVYGGGNTAAVVAAGDDDEEDEEDKEKLVLARLKSVTKRQRAVAAKKVASDKSEDAPLPRKDNYRGQHQLQQYEHQVPLPAGFIPLDNETNLPASRHNSTTLPGSLPYDPIGNQERQQHHKELLQRQSSLTSLKGNNASAGALILPLMFELGNDIIKGKAVQLTINHISVPAIVINVDEAKQAVLLAVRGNTGASKTVVLQARDEGSRYRLAFI